jgi:hypothetical protein
MPYFFWQVKTVGTTAEAKTLIHTQWTIPLASTRSLHTYTWNTSFYEEDKIGILDDEKNETNHSFRKKILREQVEKD